MASLVIPVVALVAIGTVIAMAYRNGWQWTGLPASQRPGSSDVPRPAKTLWDWLQLLVIPVAVASLAFVLSSSQSRRDQRHEDRQAARQRSAATDAEREGALRTYLAQMSDLMLDRQLRRSSSGSDVREVARTATLTAVRRLDGQRRGLVVRFLAEAGLIRRGRYTGPRIALASADLGQAALEQAGLFGADLARANLTGANLVGADLVRAYLVDTTLVQARLSRANLELASLRLGDLAGADLRGSRRYRAN